MTREWYPISNCPFMEVVWARNKNMDRPVKATRGYTHNGMVHENRNFFTSVYTPDKYFPFPGGNLVIPDEWRPLDND